MVLADQVYCYAVYRCASLFGNKSLSCLPFRFLKSKCHMGCLREGVDAETRGWFALLLVFSILLIFDSALFLVDRTSSTMDCCLVSQ